MPTTPPEQEPREDSPRPLRRTFNARGAWPPEYAQRPGQRPPRRFSALTAIQAIWPGYVQLFTGRVPEEFWAIEEGDAGSIERTVVVSCQCGAEPKVAQNQTAICPGEECGRVFMLLGDEIRVARFDPAELAAAE